MKNLIHILSFTERTYTANTCAKIIEKGMCDQAEAYQPLCMYCICKYCKYYPICTSLCIYIWFIEKKRYIYIFE